MTCGIYFIQSPSGKMYVGSSENIEQRLKLHFSLLRCGRHASTRLTRAWEKYAGTGFTSGTLEECESAVLEAREEHWIKLLKPNYNRRMEVTSNAGLRMTAEEREQLSRSMKAASAPGTEHHRHLTEQNARNWADPESKARRVEALRAAWTPEKRAEQSERQKGIDNGEAARVARWSKPGASERASAAMKASWASRKKVTLEVIQELCDERGLELVSFDGQRVTVRCPKHDHTASPDKRKFVYAGQGCRFCGFERSSEKQKRRSDGP